MQTNWRLDKGGAFRTTSSTNIANRKRLKPLDLCPMPLIITHKIPIFRKYFPKLSRLFRY
jgi:hypothetical protein